MQHYILYQAYGTLNHINECRYSLLKYLELFNLNPPPEQAIIIYTDQPAAFESYAPFFHQFEMKEISETEIKEWKGSIDFVHRVKIEIIKEFFRYYNGNLLYLDTDTYITAPVESIFNEIESGIFYLHEYEGQLDSSVTPDFHKWVKFLVNNKINYNYKEVTFSSMLKMWNAGVIGMNSQQKDILTDVLALTEAVYKKFPKHIVEQFAFSYCFQHDGTVKSSANEIKHYWNLKEFRKLLLMFFNKNQEESIPNLVKLVHPLDAFTIQKDKIVYQKMSLFKKILHSLSGTHWNIKKYETKII